MSQKSKIILVEDDADLGIALKNYLEISGYQIMLFSSAADVIKSEATIALAELAILDVMLPDMDGFRLGKLLAEKHNLPFLFLTAKGQSIDRVLGLKLGAEDYISKPCDPEELLLRIRNILKHHHNPDSPQEFSIGIFKLYPNDLLLKSMHHHFILTEKEKDILLLLNAKKNQILYRKDILEKLWGENDYFYGRSLDVFMTRLRKYLSHDEQIRIETVRGVGYILNI